MTAQARKPRHHRRNFKPCGRPPALPPARLAYLAGRIHRLGPRPLYELLREIEAGLPLAERLEAYSRLAELATFIAAFGGADLPVVRLVTPVRKGKGAP